jgi:hypothetical protein
LAQSWLIDEAGVPDSATLLEESAAVTRSVRGGSAALAVRLNEVVIHDTRKWFGGADIRLDAIVVHGTQGDTASNGGFYQPTTFRFTGVRDGEQLPIDAPGLLVFYGRPEHFIDLSILASRDRGDSEELGDLLEERVSSQEWSAATRPLLDLAMAAPQATLIGAALSGAVVVANLAAKALAAAVGDSIGLYRVSWLQHRDRFGLGRHPAEGAYRHRDFGFWYEIVTDRATRRRRARGDAI